jgi:hypothetical protein
MYMLNEKLEQQVRNVYVERKVRTTGKKVWMFTIYLVLCRLLVVCLMFPLKSGNYKLVRENDTP